MEEIKQWLNGARGYEAGVQLLLNYSPDQKLKRLFQMEGPSDFKRKKLLETLLQLVQTGAQVQQLQEQQKEHVQKHIAVAHKGWPKEMDEVLTALHHQWKPLYAEMQNLTARLYDVAKSGNEAEAGRMAHRILDLDDQCDVFYYKRDHYLQHHELPGDKKPAGVVVDPVKIPVALQNAQRYVREFKNKLKKDPTNEQYAALLKKWEERALHYKTELKLV